METVTLNLLYVRNFRVEILIPSINFIWYIINGHVISPGIITFYDSNRIKGPTSSPYITPIDIPHSQKQETNKHCNYYFFKLYKTFVTEGFYVSKVEKGLPTKNNFPKDSSQLNNKLGISESHKSRVIDSL